MTKPHSLDLSQVNRSAPPIPSKWDIIPIHASDRATFKFCRRQWAWSSPSRANLIPKSSVHGIREPLWFGSGIHYALERFYNHVLHEDPVIAFTTWFMLQWEGGLVSESEVKEFADRNPIQTVGNPGNYDGDTVPTFRVDGLKDILPMPDEDHFMELLDLGQGMMRFYKEYAQREDNFSVIATEHEFSVPILDPNGEPLYWIDNRTMPEDWEPDWDAENSYGHLMFHQDKDGRVQKQVHARGRMDLIIQDQESGQFGIKDYKTTSRLDDDYFRHLELDEQCTSYLTLGEVEARTYGLEYHNLDFIIYEALLKGYPKPPTITSRGVPSVDRQNETTTAAMFEECIKKNGLQAIFDSDEKMQNYYTWLLELGDKRFINRTPTYRNKIQKENAMIRLYYEAIDMLNDPRLYPNPTKNYGCLNCVFRAPCIAAEDGSDWKAILEDGYMPNWDR